MLSKKTCEACKVGASKVTEDEKEKYLPIIPLWTIISEDEIEKIKRDFIFKNFKEALNFTNKVGALAEEENHHPDITTGYGKVTVVWYTHKINGLHFNDLIMAAKTDIL